LQREGIAPAKATLTPKQAQIADLYARGMSKRAIALYLGVHPSTVRDHLRAADLKARKQKT